MEEVNAKNGDIGTERDGKVTFLAEYSKRHPAWFRCLHRWITIKKIHTRMEVLILQTCRRCGSFRETLFTVTFGSRIYVEGKTTFLKIEDDYKVMSRTQNNV